VQKDNHSFCAEVFFEGYFHMQRMHWDLDQTIRLRSK